MVSTTYWCRHIPGAFCVSRRFPVEVFEPPRTPDICALTCLDFLLLMIVVDVESSVECYDNRFKFGPRGHYLLFPP